MTLPFGLKSREVQASFLLLVAVSLGGGGSGVGLANLAVQLVAMSLLACNGPALVDFFRRAPRFPAILVGCTLLLPLLQSVPLPPAMWQGLPGRDAVVQSLTLIGKQDVWFPMTLNTNRTLIALLSLLPPLAMIVLSWRLPEASRRNLTIFAVILALGVVFLGSAQLASGNRMLMLFDEGTRSTNLQGTFANHNSIGLFFDIALCLLIGTLPVRPRRNLLAAAVLAGLTLGLGLVLTQSRSSMALGLVPLSFAFIRLLRSGLSKRALAALIGAVVLTGLAASALVLNNHRVGTSLARFEKVSEDRRPEIWEDTTTAIGNFWPLGSGIGSFDDVFQAAESLEYLSPKRAGRAHNDYLEMTLESGFAGIAILGAWMIFLGLAGWQALRRGPLAQAGAAAFLLLGLQSIVDYPLRNQTSLCLAGLFIVLLLPGSRTSGKPSFRRTRD